MPLIKTLSQTLKQDKEKFKVPRSVQQAIPIRKIWPDGIFQVESKFSRTFRFTDINYSIASKADKTEMFLDYSELLNALDSGCTAKITLNNRKINKEEFEQSLLIPMKGDGLDEYRKEYNDMLLSKISGTNNSIYQERYLTVSVHKKNTAVLIPFHTQEIMQPGGIYYGQNAVSKNMLVADRRKLLNGNSFRLGVSGSGKSFSANATSRINTAFFVTYKQITPHRIWYNRVD